MKNVKENYFQEDRRPSDRYFSPSPADRLAKHTRLRLSERELQVLALIARGLRNKEIGSALSIAEDTVKVHIKNIFGKLDVIDRTQAVVTALEQGFIQLRCSPVRSGQLE